MHSHSVVKLTLSSILVCHSHLFPPHLSPPTSTRLTCVAVTEEAEFILLSSHSDSDSETQCSLFISLGAQIGVAGTLMTDRRSRCQDRGVRNVLRHGHPSWSSKASQTQSTLSMIDKGVRLKYSCVDSCPSHNTASEQINPSLGREGDDESP